MYGWMLNKLAGFESGLACAERPDPDRVPNRTGSQHCFRLCLFQVDPNEIYLRLEQLEADTPTSVKVSQIISGTSNLFSKTMIF
jgi:hypothetical protein